MGAVTWPTPIASDGEKGPVWHIRGNPGLALAVKLLWPTPDAAVSNDGENLEGWEARRQEIAAKGINGNGMGTPLAIAVQRPWPTPEASDGTGGRRTREIGGVRPSGAKRSIYLSTVAGTSGLLNPRWVEILMGWPLGFVGLPPEVLGPLAAALRKRSGSRKEPAAEPRSGGNS